MRRSGDQRAMIVKKSRSSGARKKPETPVWLDSKGSGDTGWAW
jgi:hypothetical protein